MRSYPISLLVIALCPFVSGQTNSTVHHAATPTKSAPLTPDQITDKIVDAADKLAGKQLFLCLDSQYKPQDAEGKPQGNAWEVLNEPITIQSASVFTVPHPPQLIYDRKSGGEFPGPCDGKSTCYEVDAIGTYSGLIKSAIKTIMVPAIFQASDLKTITPQTLLTQFMYYQSAVDHKISLQHGISESDVRCYLGKPDEINDYGNGGLQWVYESRGGGPQYLVYLSAKERTVVDVQILHQRP